MKKSIFLFFAAILCAMSVSAKVIYFKPNSNWAQANANFYAHVWGGSGATSPVKFTPVATDPAVYQAEVGTHTSIIFLRMDPSKTVTSSNMWNNPPLWNRMGNLSIPTNGNNCCAIKSGQWSQDQGTTNGAASYVTWSTYTPPTTVPDYYLTGTLAGGWNANDVKMTYDEATETYSHTFTAVAANAEQKFKVTNGTWSTSWGGANVSPAIDGITTDGDGNAVFTLSTAGNVTVTFKDSKIQVTTTGAFKVPVTYPYYILGTMNSWSVEEEYGLADENEDGIYTREITLAAGEHFFKINIGKWDSQWGWSNVVGAYTEATDAKDDNKIKITLASEKTFTVEFNKSKNQISFDGLTKIEDYYTVVGVADLFGEAWSTKNEANKMAKQGDGSYKLVKENVTLAAIGYDWKIAKNGDWWNDAATGVNPSGGGNNTLTITTAGRYNVTFTLAADLKTAKAETKLLEATVVIPDCFISGNKNLTGKETEWQGNEFTMVYDEETETWSYTLAGLQPEKAYELKVVCGGTWYSYANLTSIPTGVTEGNDHSIAFKMAAAGDVVVTYNVETGITLSGNFAEPVTYDYYLTGTLVGGWSAKQQGLEKDDELYKATFNALAAGTYQFKITDGQFNTEEDKTHEHTTLAAEYKEVSYVDGNIQFVTEEAKNITVIFDATANKITIDGLTKVTHTYTIAGDAALCGEAWNWELESNDMTNNGDGTYTWTKAGVTVESELSFKVFVDHKSEPAYPAENWVIKPENYEGNGVYDVTITFTESSKEVAVALTKQEVTPTLVTPSVEKGIFSVADGKFVQFSTGNLQYNVGTNTWSFAANQYDYVGEANINVGDPTFTGTIDMFGWSTNDADNNYGVNPNNVNGLYDGTFQDWGDLVNEADWYTLSADEWKYLLNTRANAANLKQIAKVNNVVGIMLFPDAWTMPADVNVAAAYDSYFKVNIYNYTPEQWTKLEEAGAVFLPAAGRRTGGYGNMINKEQETEIRDEYLVNGGFYRWQDNTNIYCYYWTSTINKSTKDVSFLHNIQALGNDEYTIGTGAVWGEKGRYGQSVRLVKKATPDYERTVTSGDYGTICLPNGGLLFGASAFSVAKMEGTTILLDEVGTTMVAGTPYVVFPNTGAKKLYVFYTDNANAPVGYFNGLYGSYTRTELTPNDGNYIMLPGNKYAEVTGDRVYVGENRAYFKVDDIEDISTTAPAPAPGVRRIAIGQAPQVATGMENIDASAQPVKTIINGQLFILRGEKMYDAQGKLVK